MSQSAQRLGVMTDMLAWSEERQIVTVPVVRVSDRRKFICVMSREALEDLSGEPPGRDGFDRDACLAALRHGHVRIAQIAHAKIEAGEIGVEDTVRITREDTAPARAVAAD